MPQTAGEGKFIKGDVSRASSGSNMPIVTEKTNSTALEKLHAQKIKQSQFATTDTAIRDHGNFRSNPWSRTIGDLGVSSVPIGPSPRINTVWEIGKRIMHPAFLVVCRSRTTCGFLIQVHFASGSLSPWSYSENIAKLGARA